MAEPSVYTPERPTNVFSLLESQRDPDIQARLVITEFQGKVNRIQKEFHHVKKQPFCGSCAKKDFQEAARREAERQKQYGTRGKRSYKADWRKLFEEFDLTPYGNFERFEVLEDTDALAEERSVVVGGITRRVKQGVHKNYRCKERGCLISIFWSLEDLEKEAGVKKPAENKKIK